MNVRYSTEEFCSICYDSYEESSGHDAVRLNCQHAFGRQCIIQWALKSNICPGCGLETIPTEVRESARSFRRLANRAIFHLDQELIASIAFGFFLAVYMGALFLINFTVNPDTALGNGVLSLISAGLGSACFSVFSCGQDPSIIFFRLHLLGAAIGFGFSALVLSIATTFS